MTMMIEHSKTLMCQACGTVIAFVTKCSCEECTLEDVQAIQKDDVCDICDDNCGLPINEDTHRYQLLGG